MTHANVEAWVSLSLVGAVGAASAGIVMLLAEYPPRSRGSLLITGSFVALLLLGVVASKATVDSRTHSCGGSHVVFVASGILCTCQPSTSCANGFLGALYESSP